MKIGIIGCGFIGSELAQFIDQNKNFKLIALNDVEKNKVDVLIRSLKNNKPKFMMLEDLIKNSDFIIESAKKEVVKEILKNKYLDKKNKKLLIMSTSGLIGNLELLGKIKNCGIILPSGAIAGLDAVKSVAGKIKFLTLTTTKPVSSLENAPYIIKNKINPNDIKSEETIFEGNMEEAVEGFPQNINVAATLFMASGFKNIKIKIVADPGTRFNTHEVKATGDFGEILATTKNLPSKNPRTSYLALLSAINILKNMKSNIKVGN